MTMLCAGTLGTNGPQWQDWTPERTAYLGTVLQNMLRGYTEAAVTVTSALVTFVSRFALQVSLNFSEHCEHQELPACLPLEL